MKISVITVAFNSAATIGATLASIAAQTHSDLEHIVIDGGSTDGTQDLVRRLGRAGCVLVSEHDGGIYDAMNKGLRLATGDWVGFLNADDELAHADVLHDIAAVAGATPADSHAPSGEVDAIYGDLVYVANSEAPRVVRHWVAGEFAPSRLAWGWMPPHPTLYFRRGVLDRIGLFDVSFRIAADYDFVLRLLQLPAVRVRYLPQVLVRMRLGGASNRSLGAMLQKSREDWRALRKNGAGGLATLVCKNLRKLPQFF